MEKLDSIKRWLAEVKSEESRRQYLRDVKIFCGWAKLTPDDLLQERAHDLASSNPIDRLKAKDRLMRFFVESPIAESSKSHVIAAMKSFYRANGMPLGMKTPRAERVRDRDYIPTREDIQRMVRACTSKRDATMIMVQAQTGLRIGALTSLQWKHIATDLNYPSLAPMRNPVQVLIPDAITQPGVTFICQDAAHCLRQLLLGRDLKPDTPIFDIGPTAAMKMIRRVATKAGIVKEGKGVSEFRSHCFRKRMQTILEAAGIPLNFVDLLLDHIPRGAQAKAYSRPNEEMMREAYMKAESALRVF